MRRSPASAPLIPTEEESIAIARLLMARARDGAFGLDGRGRPPGIWNTTGGWMIRFPMETYCLNHIQASALALGKVAIDQAQKIVARAGRLYVRGERDGFGRHEYPTSADGFPPVKTLRKTASSELSYLVQVPETRKAASGRL